MLYKQNNTEKLDLALFQIPLVNTGAHLSGLGTVSWMRRCY